MSARIKHLSCLRNGYIDILCSTVTVDPLFPISLYLPTACYCHSPKKIEEMPYICFLQELADRWQLNDKSSVKTRLEKMCCNGYISYATSDTKWGVYIFPAKYFEYFEPIVYQEGNKKNYIKDYIKAYPPPTADKLLKELKKSVNPDKHKEIKEIRLYTSIGWTGAPLEEYKIEKRGIEYIDEKMIHTDSVFRQAIFDQSEQHIFEGEEGHAAKETLNNRIQLSVTTCLEGWKDRKYRCTFITQDGKQIDIYTDLNWSFSPYAV